LTAKTLSFLIPANLFLSAALTLQSTPTRVSRPLSACRLKFNVWRARRAVSVIKTRGASPRVALKLHVTHRVEHVFERTFQVAEDASIRHPLVLQLHVRRQDQVAREPEPCECEFR